MALIQQIVSVTLWNIVAIPSRLGNSLVICVGIAGVVAVLISVLAMATGLEKALGNAGRIDRAILLRTGAIAEVVSALDREVNIALDSAPGVARLDDGSQAVSPEVILSVTLTNSASEPVGVGVRGITERAWSVRKELQITAGRRFVPGLQEVIVGKAVSANLPGLKIGDSVPMYGSRWLIVGEFTSNGDIHESEIIADAASLMSAAQRTVFSATTLVLAEPNQLEVFAAKLKADPRLKVEVHRESDFYAKQSEDASALLFIIANVVGGVMALGALFGALNTMYSAISARATEIATLRAIGFGATPVVVSVLIESLVLAVVGALVGAAIAWLIFNGQLFSTSGGVFAQVALKMDIGGGLIALGMLWGATIGLLGGLLPAWRSARMSVADALRKA